MAQLTSLPLELITPLLGQLGPADIRRLSYVNRRMRAACERLLLKNLHFRICALAPPPRSHYRALFKILRSAPHKRPYIESLFDTGHAFSCSSGCSLPALADLPASDSPADLELLHSTAKGLGFPHGHLTPKTEEESQAAWLLLCLYCLPSLSRIEFQPAVQGNPKITWLQSANSTLQKMAELAVGAPAPPPPALSPAGAFRAVCLGSERRTVAFPYNWKSHHGEHLQAVMPWMFLPSLEMLRADNMTDERAVDTAAEAQRRSKRLGDIVEAMKHDTEEEVQEMIIRDPEGIDYPYAERRLSDTNTGHYETRIVPLRAPTTVEPKSSPVKHILLRWCDVGNDSFEQMLRYPKALESFIWEQHKAFRNGSGREKVSARALGESLKHQKDTLKTLVITYDGSVFLGCRESDGYQDEYDCDDEGTDEDEEDEEDYDLSDGEGQNQLASLQGKQSAHPLNDRLTSLQPFSSLTTLALPLRLLIGYEPWTERTLPPLHQLLPDSLTLISFSLSSDSDEYSPRSVVSHSSRTTCEHELIDVVKHKPNLEHLMVLRSSEELEDGEWMDLASACEERGVKLGVCGLDYGLPWWDLKSRYKGDTACRNDVAQEKVEQMVRWLRMSGWWPGEY